MSLVQHVKNSKSYIQMLFVFVSRVLDWPIFFFTGLGKLTSLGQILLGVFLTSWLAKYG